MPIIAFTPPMECRLVKQLPEGPEWVYELKLDGYRAQAIHDVGGVRLLSRNGKDFSKRFPRVVASLVQAIAPGTVVDGELVALDADGRPSFQALQNAQPDTQVSFYAFDILRDAGNDVRALPLRDRLAHLDTAYLPNDDALLCEYFPGPAADFAATVRRIGGEGVVAKRLDKPYEAEGRRSGAWSKLRLNLGQEFVIGGYTLGSNGFDAVIVGYYRGKELVYVARVRAGFVPVSRRNLSPELESRRIEGCPFINLPQASAGRWGQGLTAAKMKECIWIRPELVAAFEFLEWTNADHVRHIKYLGLRSDKDPLRVVRETASEG
jgi:DNA ligase D-like protein (predicted ligase)